LNIENGEEEIYIYIYIYTRARAQRLVDELKEAVIVQKDCLYSYLEESFACRDDKVYSAGTKGLALLVP